MPYLSSLNQVERQENHWEVRLEEQQPMFVRGCPVDLGIDGGLATIVEQ
jgi:hypothetical protein